jgi:hypothetical protein
MFLTSVLVGGEWQASYFSCFISRVRLFGAYWVVYWLCLIVTHFTGCGLNDQCWIASRNISVKLWSNEYLFFLIFKFKYFFEEVN